MRQNWVEGRRQQQVEKLSNNWGKGEWEGESKEGGRREGGREEGGGGKVRQLDKSLLHMYK